MTTTIATTRFSPGALVHARGREWLVLPGSEDEVLRLRPLSGTDADAVVLHTRLEREPVKEARFPAPTLAEEGSHDAALLLRDALLLTLRRGAGPFRSFGHISVVPHAYQLVPLLMALKQETVRLLIADDVGIGKTIEAALILRELLDRGEVERSTVLCPPHLVDQWVRELQDRFHVNAVAVTAAGASRLERQLPPSMSLFQAHPHTVVSLDYIKSDRRRASFLQTCPELVIVDEAHACVGGGARHRRQELLEDLARNAERHLLLLTATPHSGDEDAFYALLSLLSPTFQALESADEEGRKKLRERLRPHFVQRRRVDIDEWKDRSGAFPVREKSELTYQLNGEWDRFFHEVLGYCKGVIDRYSGGQQDAAGARRAHLGLFSTLALMRCVASSPVAAIAALRARAGDAVDEEGRQELIDRIFDGDGGSFSDDDVEPATLDDPALGRLIEQATALATHATDPKLELLLKHVDELLGQGFHPVIFCRYISTAHYVYRALRERYEKNGVVVDVVTGELTNDERRAAVDAFDLDVQRILVATDCLSEGINLQEQFNAVVHYDLSWNPTRHEQREGRVDRHGQKSEVKDKDGRPLVRCTLLYGDHPVDGAVLEVIVKKAARIREELGVAVPLPDEGRTLSAALMKAVLLRGNSLRTAQGKGQGNTQGAFAFMELDAAKDIEARWESVLEKAKKHRTIFSQQLIKTEAVLAEHEKVRAALGTADDVERFVSRACTRLGAPLSKLSKGHAATLSGLPEDVRERLDEVGLSGTVRLDFGWPAVRGARPVERSHPLVSVLAETLLGRTLEDRRENDPAVLGRTGAWQSTAVTAPTTVLLLRLRHQLAFKSGRGKTLKDRAVVVEEAVAVAFAGPVGVVGPVADLDAFALLLAPPAADVPTALRSQRLAEALAALPARADVLADVARARAAVLLADHLRVKQDSRATGTPTVEAVLPPDVMGLFLLFPKVG